MDPYTELAAALAADGIRCHFQSPGQMVVSGQVGPVWPDRGNSFWVTHAGERWHLFTWAPIGYSVPDGAQIVTLCRECMAHGSSAMYVVPNHIVEQFALRELSGPETASVYADMEKLG